MKKKNRNVEIFSLSALDLFASAMGAFVLLTVIMLPYYLKGKTYEDERGQLQAALAAAGDQAMAARKLLSTAQSELAATELLEAVKPDPLSQKLEAERQKNAIMAAKITNTKMEIEQQKEALKKKVVVKKVTKKKKVTFRFLGLKTDENRYLVLVDGSARMKQYATNLPKILTNTISVFGQEIEFAVAFYHHGDGKPTYSRWPKTGFTRGSKDTRSKARDFMKREYDRMKGGSSTYDALLTAIGDDTESIIFISDGFIFPKHNRGMNWQQVAQNISSRNSLKIEINAAAVGIFYKHLSFASFLNELSLRNKGDFKAIPP